MDEIRKNKEETVYLQAKCDMPKIMRIYYLIMIFLFVARAIIAFLSQI